MTLPPNARCCSSIFSGASTTRAGAGATTRTSRRGCPSCSRLARQRSAGRPRAAHVDHTDLAAAARSARKRLQGIDGSIAGGSGDREARQQLLHRDVARSRAAASRLSRAGHRGAHDQSLRLDDRADGRQPGLRHLGRVRRHGHLRSRRSGRRRASRRTDSSLALSDLHGEFATVVDTQTVVASLAADEPPATRDSHDPNRRRRPHGRNDGLLALGWARTGSGSSCRAERHRARRPESRDGSVHRLLRVRERHLARREPHSSSRKRWSRRWPPTRRTSSSCKQSSRRSRRRRTGPRGASSSNSATTSRRAWTRRRSTPPG